jgi:DNA-binding NarL/FixJ family response regulator
MPPITILIADDHALVRRGFVQILSLYPEFTVVADVANGKEAVAKAKELGPALVMMDLNMPEMNGMDATRLIKKFDADVCVVIVSAYADEGYVQQAFNSGADAYLLKTADPDNLRAALLQASERSGFICPHLTPAQLRAITNPLHVDTSSPQHLINQLTTREREILQLIAEAKSHHQIAQQLNISVRTVDTHHNNILTKLGIHDSVSLVTFAVKNRLVVL